jgi:DNA-binding transcriptional LysR family regulator
MRYFYEVCRWQNITKAAEHLHVSQPTISMSMQTLEAETGLNIFQREGRKIIITPEGSKLLGKVKHILTQVDQLEEEISDMAHNRNHIRLAMPLQLGTQFLPKILGEFRQQNPEIRLDIIESGGISALHMVEEEKLDMAFTNYETGFSQKLNYEKLFACECCLVTSREHPLAGKTSITMADIINEPLVLLDSSFFVYRMVHELFAQEKCKPQVVHYSPYLHTIKNLVRTGIGCTFLTRQAVLPRDDLAVIPMEQPFYINSGIVTKKGRQVYDDERRLIKYLKEITRNLNVK